MSNSTCYSTFCYGLGLGIYTGSSALAAYAAEGIIGVEPLKGALFGFFQGAIQMPLIYCVNKIAMKCFSSQDAIYNQSKPSMCATATVCLSLVAINYTASSASWALINVVLKTEKQFSYLASLFFGSLNGAVAVPKYTRGCMCPSPEGPPRLDDLDPYLLDERV